MRNFAYAKNLLDNKPLEPYINIVEELSALKSNTIHNILLIQEGCENEIGKIQRG